MRMKFAFTLAFSIFLCRGHFHLAMQVFLNLLTALCGVCSQSELTSLCFLQMFIAAY